MKGPERVAEEELRSWLIREEDKEKSNGGVSKKIAHPGSGSLFRFTRLPVSKIAQSNLRSLTWRSLRGDPRGGDWIATFLECTLCLLIITITKLEKFGKMLRNK